jgi:hypothetical protein
VSTAGGAPTRRAAAAAPLAALLLLIGGCAAASRPTATPGSVPGGSAASRITRCSPADPDRHAWFCVFGQILYGVAGSMAPDGSITLR